MVIVMMIIIVSAKTTVIEQIVNDRRSGARIDIWGEKMIQFGPVQIISRHLLSLHCGPIFLSCCKRNYDPQALSQARP